MVNKLIAQGKKILSSQQTSVLSAATLIMLMVVASRVLGLVRQRTLAHFFTADQLSLFFAAFRLPDLIFEVLVFGAFSSAFIPVFTGLLKKGKKEAWQVAATIVNLGVLAFLVVSGILVFFSPHLYGILAPGFTNGQQVTIVSLTRLLFVAQGFFIVSYVLTAVLESSRRFLVPAIAPLFYNLGIIAGTHLFASKLGLMAPVMGVIMGAFLHFLIQLPLSMKLGFKFLPKIVIDTNVKKIGHLALPRVFEVSFTQISKTVELFLSSLISTASFTYFTLGSAIYLLPVGLFGTSLAKAALPTLARQRDDKPQFKRTLYGALYQMIFLILPISTALIVLRIPVVRLIFGTDIFSWEATVQTGLVVSAFSFGVIFQAANSLLSRSFYALQDTKTPVIVSISSIVFNIVLAFVFIRVFHLPTWGLAAAFSIGSFIQATALFVIMNRRLESGSNWTLLIPVFKSIFASVVSGSVMFLILKFFDRSVWIKELSFFGKVDGVRNLPFENFVLDTRYTWNLLALTLIVIFVGIVIYFGVLFLLRSKELWYFWDLVRRIFITKKVSPVPAKETETISPPPGDSNSS